MIKEVKPQNTAEQQNDSSPPSASKAQEQLTDEQIHIKDLEQAYHEGYDETDEEIEIEW